MIKHASLGYMLSDRTAQLDYIYFVLHPKRKHKRAWYTINQGHSSDSLDVASIVTFNTSEVVCTVVVVRGHLQTHTDPLWLKQVG